AAGQRIPGLPEANVVEPDLAEHVEPLAHRRDGAEDVDRLGHRQVEHVRDRETLEAHLEGLALVAAPATHFARDEDVRKKMHLDRDHPVAGAGFAAPALHVERESTRAVATRAGLWKLREQLANRSEEARVRRRVGARATADRRLADLDDLVDELPAG